MFLETDSHTVVWANLELTALLLPRPPGGLGLQEAGVEPLHSVQTFLFKASFAPWHTSHSTGRLLHFHSSFNDKSSVCLVDIISLKRAHSPCSLSDAECRIKSVYVYIYTHICIHTCVWHMYIKERISLCSLSYAERTIKIYMSTYIHTYMCGIYTHMYIHVYDIDEVRKGMIRGGEEIEREGEEGKGDGIHEIKAEKQFLGKGDQQEHTAEQGRTGQWGRG